MGKVAGDYTGEPSKRDFPAEYQRHESGCGLACLRMLEQWTTGKARSEDQWMATPYWDSKRGVLTPPMRAALRNVANLDVSPIYPRTVAAWRSAPGGPDPMSPDSVYLLRTDCYAFDGANLQHWIIVADVFWGEKRRLLALVADPLRENRTLEVRPWDALLATKVISGFIITRVSPAGE